MDNKNTTSLSFEDMQLLIGDLSMRLPHGVWIDLNGIRGKINNLDVTHYYDNSDIPTNLKAFTDFFIPNEPIDICNFKPLLRKMTDMTKEEESEYTSIKGIIRMNHFEEQSMKLINFLLIHHFDFQGLIEKGLAIEVKYDFYF